MRASLILLGLTLAVHPALKPAKINFKIAEFLFVSLRSRPDLSITAAFFEFFIVRTPFRRRAEQADQHPTGMIQAIRLRIFFLHRRVQPSNHQASGFPLAVL